MFTSEARERARGKPAERSDSADPAHRVNLAPECAALFFYMGRYQCVTTRRGTRLCYRQCNLIDFNDVIVPLESQRTACANQFGAKSDTLFE